MACVDFSVITREQNAVMPLWTIAPPIELGEAVSGGHGSRWFHLYGIIAPVAMDLRIGY